MPPYSEAEARALLERVLTRSKAEGCEAKLQASRTGNIRFARNAVSTSGVVDDATLVIQSRYGMRLGAATANQFDDESLTRTIRRSEDLARVAPEDPELQPMLGPQPYVRPSTAYATSGARVTADFRAGVAAKSIAEAKSRGCVAAGFLTDSAGSSALLNSRGMFGYFADTTARFTVTARTESGGGSGWGGQDLNDIARLDAEAVTRVASEKAVASRDVRSLEPGQYTVILEPAASVDLVQQLVLNSGAREAEEGRSFLSKPGGGTKLGQRLVDERVTIYSDPASAVVPCTPWDDEGLPRTRTVWLEKGMVRTLGYTRYWARKQGKSPIAAPGNWVMEGGDQSLEDLIRGTERGVLVTRTWYIRTVDPKTLLYTGLTRDGTFYVEKGRVAYAVKNFRFNESPVIMLNNLDALGRPTRVRGSETQGPAAVPPMRIRNFTFSSLSDAV
jgi:predicted Zn-dependent protease